MVNGGSVGNISKQLMKPAVGLRLIKTSVTFPLWRRFKCSYDFRRSANRYGL
jgi:hypothetical protein